MSDFTVQFVIFHLSSYYYSLSSGDDGFEQLPNPPQNFQVKNEPPRSQPYGPQFELLHLDPHR